MKIIKHSGHVVEFDSNKLRNSLLRSGASDAAASDIIHAVEKDIYDGMPTKQIYKLAFSMLKKMPGSTAARYNLRSALQQLGPAGFFFEKFVARIFEAEGFNTLTNLSLQGRCVSHEVDVALEKNSRLTLVECKFHGRRESVSDVKVPMYILSRFNDLKSEKHHLFNARQSFSDCLIVTNNRFTADAQTFARCSSIKLMSWDHPHQHSLREKIDSAQLYPVTCLTTLSAFEKEQLLIMDIIMASDITPRVDELSKIGLSHNRIKNVLREVSELCKYL